MGVSDDKIATGRTPSDEKSRRGRQQTSKYQHGATSNKLQIIFWEKKNFSGSSFTAEDFRFRDFYILG